MQGGLGPGGLPPISMKDSTSPKVVRKANRGKRYEEEKRQSKRLTNFAKDEEEGHNVEDESIEEEICELIEDREQRVFNRGGYRETGYSSNTT